MPKYCISNSLVGRFMQRVQQKVNLTGSISKNEFDSLMQDLLKENSN